MVSALIDSFRKEVSKSKDPRAKKEAEFDVAYPTGYLAFDFMNGCVVDVKKEDRQFRYNSLGLVDGTMISIVGRSGCGKTTLALQWAGNIVRNFPNSAIFHEDLEGGSSSQRKRQLMKFSEEEFEAKYICRNTGISTENLFERIKMIHDIKVNNREEYEYDTGLYTPEGERIFKLQPTVILLDSWAMLMSDNLAEGESIEGSMAVTSNAKTNTQLVRRVLPLLKSANILFFVINHILPDPSPVPKKAQVAWLKMGERCPGGESAIYLANNFIRVDDSSKLSAEKDLGINGIMVDLQLVKSRTNRPGAKVPMILNYATGFDPELSLYALLKESKRVNGAGAYLYIGEHSECKFRQSDIKNKLMTSPEFAKIFMDECFDVLNSLINQDVSLEKREEASSLDITSLMMQSMNQMG